MSFTIVKFFYILFTTVKAFYQRQIPSVTTAIVATASSKQITWIDIYQKKLLF